MPMMVEAGLREKVPYAYPVAAHVAKPQLSVAVVVATQVMAAVAVGQWCHVEVRVDVRRLSTVALTLEVSVATRCCWTTQPYA